MASDTFLMDLGSRVAHRRKEKHLTQESLAEMMGVSLQTVSCIELGKKGIRPENLARLCQCLEVTSDYILYGKRSTDQMSNLFIKIAKLNQEEYQAIQQLVEVLLRNRSES